MLSRCGARHYTRPAMPNNRVPPKPVLNRLFAAAGVALGLSACSSGPQFAPPCPELKLLTDGADLSAFDANGQDITNLILAARITAVPASCSSGGSRSVDATMHVVMRVNRGPALSGSSASVPYFVTIMDGDHVLEQKDYTQPVKFPSNVDSVDVNGDDIAMSFPVTAQKSAAAYTIYLGFRLTPQQLQYNRQHRTP